jgi:5'-3' exoribonuclease 1
MGVKHFYIWFQKNYSNCINKEVNKFKNNNINNLCLDLNGIIHTCAQKVYEYGNNKKQRFLKKKVKPKNTLNNQIKLFSVICEEIENLRKLILPQNRIIICTDGVAGVAKLAQQRQRRFKSAREAQESGVDKDDFNPNCITAGTKFMDFLSKYIDWYCRMMISHNPDWKNLEIIISNEKVSGEGEHKIINFIRKYGKECESFCIHGLDADLIMLSMSLENNNIFVLRENQFPPETHLVNIFKFKESLKLRLKWEVDENTKSFRSPQAITDFVFLCFLVGNDFLPNIPGLAILEGGIENMLDIYKDVCSSYGHLTRNSRKIGNMLNLESLVVYLHTLSTFEKGLLEEKMMKKESFMEDKILDKYITYEENKVNINMENYKSEYYEKKLQGVDNIKRNCLEYLDGMNWVINYYKKGIPSWDWYYPSFYAPFLSDIYKYVKDYKYVEGKGEPLSNLEQMMCVLPKISHNLLSPPFDKLLYESLKDFYPEDFIIDYSGKRREWEGIVLIKMVDVNVIKEFYNKYKNMLSELDQKRNKKGETYKFNYEDKFKFIFKSFYGDIKDCCINKKFIEL